MWIPIDSVLFRILKGKLEQWGLKLKLENSECELQSTKMETHRPCFGPQDWHVLVSARKWRKSIHSTWCSTNVVGGSSFLEEVIYKFFFFWGGLIVYWTCTYSIYFPRTDARLSYDFPSFLVTTDSGSGPPKVGWSRWWCVPWCWAALVLRCRITEPALDATVSTVVRLPFMGVGAAVMGKAVQEIQLESQSPLRCTKRESSTELTRVFSATTWKKNKSPEVSRLKLTNGLND